VRRRSEVGRRRGWIVRLVNWSCLSFSVTLTDKSQQLRYREQDGNMYLEPPTPTGAGGSSSRSSTPPSPGSSPAASANSHLPTNAHHGPLPPIPQGPPSIYSNSQQQQQQRPALGIPSSLAPGGGMGGTGALHAPPAQPHRFGPRSPAVASVRSRTPSPEPPRSIVVSTTGGRYGDEEEEREVMTPIKPSAKALGKRRAAPPTDPDGPYSSFTFIS
jgi:hypothetical protein